jgi:branched-chain amino acid transport system ATP-binding protein
MLELSGINVHYGKMHVLRDVTLRVALGEVAALVGPNAAGKTTTLRTLVGFKDCTTGTIQFDSQAIQRLSTPDRIRLGIALVPEGRQVFPKFSVFENLRIGAFHRSDRDHLDADFESVFALFPKLAERRHQKAGLMSGGEQQMLAIGRGLMAKPRLLLLDEPTLGLAPIIVEEIEFAISRLAGEGMTILIAEQNAAMAMRVAHRVYVLTSGRISLEGPPAELAKSPEIARLYLGT